MDLYYILAFLLFLGFLLTKTKQFSSGGRRKCVFYVLVLVLSFFACLRDRTVGQDTRSYIFLFNRIVNLEWQDIVSFSSRTGYEIGYVVYNKVLSLITEDGQIVTFCNSLIFMVLAAKVLYNECFNPVIGLYLFFTLGLYQTSFNIVSSLIAAYLVLSGLRDLRERRIAKYLVRVFLGCLFHSAAFIMIIPYFLYTYRLSYKRVAIILLLSVVFAVFFQSINSILSRIVPLKYAKYLNRGADNGMILAFHLFVLAVVFIVHFVSRKSIEVYNIDDARIHLWNIIVEIFLLILAMGSNIFTRAAYFFIPSLPIFIDNAIAKVDYAGNKRVLEICLVIAIGIQYLLRLQINNIGGSVPYLLCF